MFPLHFSSARSVVATSICAFVLISTEKFFSHILHLNGSLPLWTDVNFWRCQRNLKKNFYKWSQSQILHWNFCWTFLIEVTRLDSQKSLFGDMILEMNYFLNGRYQTLKIGLLNRKLFCLHELMFMFTTLFYTFYIGLSLSLN